MQHSTAMRRSNGAPSCVIGVSAASLFQSTSPLLSAPFLHSCPFTPYSFPSFPHLFLCCRSFSTATSLSLTLVHTHIQYIVPSMRALRLISHVLSRLSPHYSTFSPSPPPPTYPSCSLPVSVHAIHFSYNRSHHTPPNSVVYEILLVDRGASTSSSSSTRTD